MKVLVSQRKWTLRDKPYDPATANILVEEYAPVELAELSKNLTKTQEELDDMKEQNRIRMRLHKRWLKKAEKTEKITEEMVSLITKTKSGKEENKTNQQEGYEGILLDDGHEFDLDQFVNNEVDQIGERREN